jgi:hypothetical protein
LHADATSVNGRIPQLLQVNLGYEMLKSDQQDSSWMINGVDVGVGEGPATSLLQK